MELLVKKYAFELIPADCEAAIKAGYTQYDREHAQCLTGPVLDGEYFYYVAYSGSLFTGSVKSSILVCRKKSTGEVKFCTNCNDYNLDLADNYIGPSRSVSRSLIAIVGDNLYLTSGYISNIGPQVYCVDKNFGDWKWSIAYYLPEEAEAFYGVKFLTKRQDYSQFSGTNARIVSHNPKAIECGNGETHIYVGCSSLQNVPAFNTGLVEGTPNYTSYPFFTDQGVLTLIKVVSDVPVMTERVFTCAPNIKIGDVLVNSPGSALNPFRPGCNQVVIGTLSGTTIASPGIVDASNPAVDGYFFSQNITVGGDPIGAADFAPFWETIGPYISVDNGPSIFTFASALVVLNQLPPGLHSISARIITVENITGTPASGQKLLWYSKVLYPGDVIENKYDAQGLNYFGNSVWGAEPLVFTPELCCKPKQHTKELIAVGTGQSHYIPLDEQMYYYHPSRNYRKLKKPLVDLTNAYVSTPLPSVLDQLNASKQQFGETIRNLSVNVLKSPRGQMSYADSIVVVDKHVNMQVAVRSIPSDTYTFLGNTSLLSRFVPDLNDIDGDASSGVFSNGSRLITVTKGGSGLILDFSNWTGAPWTNEYPALVGVNTSYPVYSGPTGILGGDNYQITQDECRKNNVIGNSANTGYLDGARGTDGNFEKFVSEQGLYVPPNSSVVQSINMEKEKVLWNTPLYFIAVGSATVADDTYLTADSAGYLYGLSTKTGAIKLVINAGADIQPMKGGVASPAYDDYTGDVYWISAFNQPIPTAIGEGKWGWVLTQDKCRKFPSDPCGDICHMFLDNREYLAQIVSTTTGMTNEARIAWTVIKCDSCVYKILLTYKDRTAEYQVSFVDNIIKFLLLSTVLLPEIQLFGGEFLTKASISIRYKYGYGMTSSAFFVIV